MSVFKGLEVRGAGLGVKLVKALNFLLPLDRKTESVNASPSRDLLSEKRVT